tara:strand:+ start:4116 stop:4601 length:486 start_codon:yes stop_codon:yes gene_type:complete
MPRTDTPTRGAKTQALNKLATLKTALAPKKPATPKQLAALQKATAIKKQKAEEHKLHRQHEQEKRDYKKKDRQMEKEFSDIMRELPWDMNHKYYIRKTTRKVLQATGEWLEKEHPFINWLSETGKTLIHRKRCELAHAIMQEFREHKAQCKRKSRKGISFR